MSQIRKTTTIEKIEVPPREPLISLEEVLTAAGWIAFQVTKLAVKTTIVGTKLAYRGGKALASAIQESRRPATFSEVTRLVASAGSAREAVTSLAASSALEVPQEKSLALAARLETLVARNDKSGVEAVARELLTGRQNRLQAQLLPIVAESCRAIGFVPTGLDTQYGIIAANREGTRQAVNIEVAKAKDGGVQIHFDAEGFADGACVQTLDALQEELRKRGVRYALHESRRKPNRPIRIGQPMRVRCAN